MYTCQACHYSGDSPIYTLRAQTERGAKLEARHLLGKGFRDHAMVLSVTYPGTTHQIVAIGFVGTPGWRAARDLT